MKLKQGYNIPARHIGLYVSFILWSPKYNIFNLDSIKEDYSWVSPQMWYLSPDVCQKLYALKKKEVKSQREKNMSELCNLKLEFWENWKNFDSNHRILKFSIILRKKVKILNFGTKSEFSPPLIVYFSSVLIKKKRSQNLDF